MVALKDEIKKFHCHDRVEKLVREVASDSGRLLWGMILARSNRGCGRGGRSAVSLCPAAGPSASTPPWPVLCISWC